MDDSLVLSFPYSAREHAEAYLASRPGRRLRRFLQAGGMLIGGSAVLATVVSALSGESGYLADAASLIALSAFWVWIGPLLLKHMTIRRFLRDGRNERRETETRAFYPDGFLPSAGWAQPVPWSEIGDVTETPQFFLIDATSDEVSYVPKRALSAEQVSLVRSLLSRHVSQDSVSRRRFPWAT